MTVKRHKSRQPWTAMSELQQHPLPLRGISDSNFDRSVTDKRKGSNCCKPKCYKRKPGVRYLSVSRMLDEPECKTRILPAKY